MPPAPRKTTPRLARRPSEPAPAPPRAAVPAASPGPGAPAGGRQPRAGAEPGGEGPRRALAPRRPPGQPYIDRGEPLPQSYAENRIAALVRSPESIYIYWDVETEDRVAGGGRLVRAHCLSERRYEDHEPPPEACNWYFRVAPDRTYRFDLLEKRDGRLCNLASSGDVTTPARHVAESGPSAPEEIARAAARGSAPEASPRGRLASATPALRAPGGAMPPAPGRRAPRTAFPMPVTPSDSELEPAPSPPTPPATPVPAPRQTLFAAAYALKRKKAR